MARILVAEDEDAVREFVCRALVHRGHDVHKAVDGIEAWQRIQAATYDLLVTDIVMPGMDGIELALKVTKERPDMAILLMTGYAAERQRAHNLDELTHRVVSKPFSLKDLCDAAEEALATPAPA